MPIGISEEHEALRATARRFLDSRCPPAVPRSYLEADGDALPPFWDELAGQGWLGLAVEEAYASPWFTSLPEEISHAVALVSVPEPGREVPEVLRQIRLRSPNAALAWADVSSPSTDERASVQILAGT